MIRGRPPLVSAVAALADDLDWLVSMRAIDLLEKLAHVHAEWIVPHKRVFIGGLAESDKWEIQLQIVRALPLFEWTEAEYTRVVAILRRDLKHSQTFVRAWALDSLAVFFTAAPFGMPSGAMMCVLPTHRFRFAGYETVLFASLESVSSALNTTRVRPETPQAACNHGLPRRHQ